MQSSNCHLLNIYFYPREKKNSIKKATFFDCSIFDISFLVFKLFREKNFFLNLNIFFVFQSNFFKSRHSNPIKLPKHIISIYKKVNYKWNTNNYNLFGNFFFLVIISFIATFFSRKSKQRIITPLVSKLKLLLRLIWKAFSSTLKNFWCFPPKIFRFPVIQRWIFWLHFRWTRRHLQPALQPTLFLLPQQKFYKNQSSCIIKASFLFTVYLIKLKVIK